MHRRNVELQMRLKSCLQTILELESELKGHELGISLVKEFKVLRSLFQRLPSIPIAERDVLRVEEATSIFLNELRVPLKDSRGKRGRLLQ